MIPSSVSTPLVVLGLVVLGLNVVGLIVLLLPRARPEGDRVVFARYCRALVAELLGTFAVLFFGLLCAGHGWATPGVEAACAGLTVAAAFAALGPISGGHFNPAVTLGMVCTGRLSIPAGLGYWVAQLAGGVIAAALLGWLFGPPSLGGPWLVEDRVPVRAVFVLEAAAMFVVVVVLYGATQSPRGPHVLAPVALGAIVAGALFAIGPLTGGVLNPVRYLAPGLLCSQLADALVYTAGPMAGAAVGAVLMHYLQAVPPPALPVVEPEETPTEAFEELEPRQAA